MCSQKKKRKIWEEEEIRRIGEIRDEKELWRTINEHKINKKKPSEKITEEEWIEHFERLLGKEEEKQKERVEEEGEDIAEWNKEIDKDEINKAIEKLKKEKSPGVDDIENEVWRHGSERMKQ